MRCSPCSLPQHEPPAHDRGTKNPLSRVQGQPYTSRLQHVLQVTANESSGPASLDGWTDTLEAPQQRNHALKLAKFRPQFFHQFHYNLHPTPELLIVSECLAIVRPQKDYFFLLMAFPQSTKFSWQHKRHSHSSVLAPLR